MLDGSETKRRRAAVKHQATNLVMINGGGKAKLADNTFWCIAPRDLPQTLDWAAGTAVTVEPTGRPIWQYKLTNVENGIEVSVATSEERF
jgi:hypothetical protein